MKQDEAARVRPGQASYFPAATAIRIYALWSVTRRLHWGQAGVGNASALVALLALLRHRS